MSMLDQQTLRKVLVCMKLNEACAFAAAVPGPFAVFLVALVGDHVGEVSEIAKVIEGADEVRVIVQGTVQVRVEVRLHNV